LECSETEVRHCVERQFQNTNSFDFSVPTDQKPAV
jgi:hypothetical protein